MSTPQLGLLQPLRQVQHLDKVLDKKYRLYRRLFLRTVRRTFRTLKSQYYITTAVADARRGIRLNEDIFLGITICAAVISFSTISILANAVYQFVSAAYAMSEITGISLAFLLLVAMSVIVVIMIWLATWLQTSLSIALLDGLNYKQHRSLRSTLHRALEDTSTVASAWTMLGFISFGPAIAIAVVIAAITHWTSIDAIHSYKLIVGFAGACILWTIWCLNNWLLVPYVIMFDRSATWKAAFNRSRRLVHTKGQLFLFSGYVLLASILAVSYMGSVRIEHAIHTSSTLLFMMIAFAEISIANIVLTVFYRKRKLARR